MTTLVSALAPGGAEMPLQCDEWGGLKTSGGSVSQAIPDNEDPASLAAEWGNFANVDTANGDFVAYVPGLNGQAIFALSASPLTTGESFVTNTKQGLRQPAALEFSGSFVRTGVSFATASLFANGPDGPDAVPAPINVVSCYQSSAVQGAAYTAVAGPVLHIMLESSLPDKGSNNAVYAGDWVNVTGLVDNRLDYANACINYISPDRRTIAVGFSDEVALPPLAVPVITPSLGSVKVVFYNNMSGARNGFGLRLTGPTPTSAAIVSIFGGDDNQVSGTLLGDHRVTVATTAPTYVAGANWGQYEIRASSRFMLECTPSCALVLDKPEQTNANWTHRDAPRTSVKPSSEALLYPRFRLFKPISMSRPIAKIVSVSKTGTTTATVITDIDHELVTGKWVTTKGVRNVVNFPAITTPTQVTVLSANSFTIVWGGAVNDTSFGGSVIIANGNRDQPGIVGQTIQSAQSIVANGANWLQLLGNANWTTVNPGDYVNIHGVRESVAGADLGLDGAWEVAHIATTGLVLRPIFDVTGARVSPALDTLALTNCGGTVILRPTLRSHDLSVRSWGETSMSIDGQGTLRPDKALPMNVLNAIQAIQSGAWTATSNQGTAAAVGTGGAGAWLVRGAAHRTIDIASAAVTTVGQTTSTAIDITANVGSHQVATDVTALTGTNVRIFTRLQGSYDNQPTGFFNIFDTPVQTAIANKLGGISPVIPVQVPFIRYITDLRGTAPSVTRSVTRMTRAGNEIKRQRRLNDRVVSLTATTASTEWLWVEGCTKAQITCTPLPGATTAPTVKLQVCNGDPVIAANWYDVPGATLALSAAVATASSYFEMAMPSQFMRLVPTVAGAGVVVDTYELALQAWEV